MVLSDNTRPAGQKARVGEQLTFAHECDIDRLAACIRELHPKRERSELCREAYRLCCEKLRSLSCPTYLDVMRDLGQSGCA